LRGRTNRPSSHPKRGKWKEEGTQLRCHTKERTIIILPGGPEMLKSSSMLRSVYSRIKELLRKTLSKYRLINKRKSGIREHRHRGRERGKHRGKCT
jgi:hypothetical protein